MVADAGAAFSTGGTRQTSVQRRIRARCGRPVGRRSVEHQVWLEATKRFAADALYAQEILDGSKLDEPLAKGDDGSRTRWADARQLGELVLGRDVEDHATVGRHTGGDLRRGSRVGDRRGRCPFG